MESKGGKKSSSSRSSLMYEAPLGYSIEDVRPAGGIEKFRSAAYSNMLTVSTSNCFCFAVLQEAILIIPLVPHPNCL
uniref:S-adenosylmethionine decarboxylase proenzyme n=1 Tax=Aegilops tauschii subsp. strangulata TaxID=200361 RepID=A0A453P2I0_AEGTS